ncbi:MAG TPA: hypothetical protein VN514_07315 [Ignavibacteria bacterium]|nr:hypothetical protein [Ignavibacteria bacterium]
MGENTIAESFNTEIEGAFRAAWHSEKGGNAEWDNVLSSYGALPLTSEEKISLLNSEMKITRGAYPIELRRVFEKIIDKFRASYQGSAELASALSAFDMDSKVKEYYLKIKPFSGLGDIFKNASTGTSKYSEGLQKEKQKTITCKNCGAPRLEEMQYDNCLFCGSPLFEIKK